MTRLPLGLVGLLLGAAVNAGEVRLADGETITFEVPTVQSGQEIVSAPGISFFTQRGVRNARLELSGALASRDLDLFVRADEPFSTPDDSDSLFAEADFWSISASGEEFVNIQDFATPSVQGRTWHVVVVGFAGLPTDATLSLTFERSAPPTGTFIVDFDNPTAAQNCDTSPWNDNGPHSPIGGNTATTLGQARREAMLEAARLLGTELSSRVPVRIRACWRDLGAQDDDGVTLASAGGNGEFFSVNLPGTPDDTIYAPAAVVRLAGTDVCRVFGGSGCEEQHVIINFNTEVSESFYYGFDAATANTVGRDFITVAMHEITHGLGFFDFFGQDGSTPTAGGRPVFGAFDRQLALLDDSGTAIALDDPSITAADRAAAFTSFDNLLWIDDQANIQADNTLVTFEAGLIRMNAPPGFQPGSSVSHVSGAYCDLMRPSLALCRSEALRGLGLARRILHGVGWADARDELPVGLFLDRSRPGHGYDVRLGGIDANGDQIFVLTFYSYRTLGGTPEWYQAVGTIRDGAFVGTRNADGNGMPRFLFDEANDPPQAADPDTFAQVAIALNNIPQSPACADGVDRSGADGRSSFQWAIGRDVGEWCGEPLIARELVAPPEFDYGGLWFAGLDDQGWGFTIETIAQADGRLDLFVLAYVYAADGTPVWFFGLAEDFQPGVPITMTMFERRGYPRIRTNGNLSDTEAGELTLTLVEPSNNIGAGNRATISVNFSGGGSWVRDDVAIQRLTAPRALR